MLGLIHILDKSTLSEDNLKIIQMLEGEVESWTLSFAILNQTCF